MSFQTSWNISGTKIDAASKAFIKSAEKSIQNLDKYEAILNKSFKEHITHNAFRAGMEADNISDVFELRIDNGTINFVNTAPLVTQRYEYGYYLGNNDTNEEYYEEYMIQTSPRYFIRPSIQESLNEVGHVILEDAKKEYTRL